MMKSIATAIVAVSVGTCGQKPLPPPPVETSTGSASSSEQGDRMAGLPEECRELLEDCSACDEVERMRQSILAKKCVPVCDAYLQHAEAIEAALPSEGIAQLQSAEICGKESTVCSPLEESACAFGVRYATAGQRYRQFWAEPGAAPPADELVTRFHEDLLFDFLEVQSELARWGDDNAVDPGAVMAAAGTMLDFTSAEELSGFHAEVSTAIRDSNNDGLEERYHAIVALLELVRKPGNPTTFGTRRKALEQIVTGDAKQ